LAALAALVPAAAAAREENLVPADFSQKTDSLGFLWDVQQNGVVNNGSNDCFDGGLKLSVNGNQFSSLHPMMTPDGAEYVLGGKAGGVEVARRIRVDTARSVARYIEVFANTSRCEVSHTVTVGSKLGGSCGEVITSGGAIFQSGLGETDSGLLTVSSTNRPCVMFLVAGPRSKVRPVVVVKSKRTFTFAYNITVKPGKTVSIVHLVAQRRGVTTANVAELFKGFSRGGRLVSAEIPKPLRRTVVNFRSGSGVDVGEPGPGLRPVLDLADKLDVERGEADVLVVGEEGRLPGNVKCGGLVVSTAYGEAALDFKDVALLAGGAGIGRQERVYLRSGEVLAGPMEAGEMAFTSEAGMEIALVPSKVDMLFMRTAPEDGRPSPGVAAFVVTRLGERLAVSEDVPAELAMATPWGPLRVALEEVQGLSYVREPRPGHRLALRDGSRLSVILTGREIRFTTPRFGPVALAPQSVEAVEAAGPGKAPVIVDGSEVLRRSERPDWAKALQKMLKKRVDFKFVDTPLSEAVYFLQTLTKVTMVLDPNAVEERGNTPITLEASDMRLDLALDWILKLADLKYVLVDEALFISTAERIDAERERIVAPADEDADGEPRWKRKLRKKLERRVSFEFVDTPLPEAVEFLAKEGKTKVVLPDEVREKVGDPKVTFRATDMTFGRALRWTTRLAGLDYGMTDGEIVIRTRPKAAGDGDKTGDESDVAAPRLLLAGDNRLVGTFGLAELQVATDAGAVSVDPAQVHVMEVDEEAEPGGTPSFSFELMDGGKLGGRLADPVLPVRAGERTFEIPVRHVREFRAPKVFQPEEEVDEDDGETEESGGGQARRRSLFGAGGEFRRSEEAVSVIEPPVFVHEEVDVVDVP
jgi:hypothetical protein